jgi:hypothetical protein
MSHQLVLLRLVGSDHKEHDRRAGCERDLRRREFVFLQFRKQHEGRAPDLWHLRGLLGWLTNPSPAIRPSKMNSGPVAFSEETRAYESVTRNPVLRPGSNKPPTGLQGSGFARGAGMAEELVLTAREAPVSFDSPDKSRHASRVGR